MVKEESQIISGILLNTKEHSNGGLAGAFAAWQQKTKNTQALNSKSSVLDSLLSKVDSYLSSYVDNGFAKGVSFSSFRKLSSSE